MLVLSYRVDHDLSDFDERKLFFAPGDRRIFDHFFSTIFQLRRLDNLNLEAKTNFLALRQGIFERLSQIVSVKSLNFFRAEGRLREWFGQRYKNADMASQVSVWGSAAKCADKLGELTEAGAELLLLNPAFDHLEQLNVLAEEVMPHL